MIKKLFNGQINSITIAAFLVALSSLISRFLGIFRDRILGGEFGLGDTLDIYYAAFRIPDLVFNLLVLGALSAGFIPVFTSLIKRTPPLTPFIPALSGRVKISGGEQEEGTKQAWQLANNVLNILGLGLIILSGLGIIFAPCLMKLIVPGFAPDKQALTVGLTRIMFLSPMFLGISSVFGGILQSFKRFFIYSLSPIMYNIGIIIGALYLVPLWGVYGLAWGVVLGALMHMLIQLPMAVKLGFRYVFRISFRDSNIRKIGLMMIPRTMSLAISQVNLLIITVIASTLAGGSLAVFNFANNLQSFPVGIFGISFAVAAFPTLSAIAADRKKLISGFSSTIRQILFFIVPATVLLLTLRAQIIRVLFGTGRFDWQDTILTIDTLGFFCLSLFAQAIIPLLVRMFYARQNSKTPFFIGLISIAVNIVLSLWLAGLLGVAGLALAFSIASIVNFILLWLVLRLEIGWLDELRILISTVKFSAAAIACGAAVQGMKLVIWPFIDMTKFWGVLTQGLAAGFSGIIAYIIICLLLRSEELFNFWSSIRRRLPVGKIEAGDQGEARGI
ncbi:MAG: murein biosynthesis integral membrane protein MurJ [Patescibacteria group bacterium]|nr:murein biosynthesis integral membrane protein MurJ [Patescibacteria group bacterium]